MSRETKQTIDTVIRTLNLISVSGKENLDMLLGSILALEQLLRTDVETEVSDG